MATASSRLSLLWSRTLALSLLLLLGVEVFRHSVWALLRDEDGDLSQQGARGPRLAFEFSWSLGCGVAAGLILLLGGGCFLLLSLPPRPWGSLCLKRTPTAA